MDSSEIPTKQAILIAGPTASGKSAVAMAVAERIGGVVVNADSMQVYRDLRILTARPSDADMARVPHRLFGHVDAAEAYSVGRWLRELRAVLDELRAANQTPVLVGGTGLYFKAATQGLSSMPAVPANVRERLRAEAEMLAPADLHARLARLDPAMAARLRSTDPQRILRALEVLEATGRSLLEFQADREKALLPWSEVRGVFLDPPRGALNAAIDQRMDLMMAAGGREEVARLATRKLDPALPAMRALGVPHIMEGLGDPGFLPSSIAAAKLATRRYAKRQFTFARNQLPDFIWVRPDHALETVISLWENGPAQ